MVAQQQPGIPSPALAERRQRNQARAYQRALVNIALIVAWSMVVLTGLLLYVLPKGQHAGQTVYVLLTRAGWEELHFWIGLVAVLVTLTHISLDWCALKGSLRCLFGGRRPSHPCD